MSIGLDHRRQIHRAARGRAGADGRVNLVDEQDGSRPGAQGADDHLEALLEVAAKPCAGEQRARVEREHLGALQNLGDVVLKQSRGEPFGHRRLADAGLADEDRVVLAAPAQDFDRALQLGGAADQRIEQALPGAVCQIQAVGRRADRARWPSRRHRRRLAPRRPDGGVDRPGWRG